jgi:hypothetical protein
LNWFRFFLKKNSVWLLFLIKTEPNRTVNTPKSHHLFLIFHPNILLISNILIHPPHMHIKGFIYACCLPIIKKIPSFIGYIRISC